MTAQTPIKIFIAYARKDKGYLLELKKYLRPLNRRRTIQIWYDGEIVAGEFWETAIKNQLNAADIILLLISADSLSSDYFHGKEMQAALDRHKAGKAEVVPIILRHCAWKLEEELEQLQALPKDGIPVSSWSDDAEAYTNIVTELHRTVLSLQSKRKQAIEAEKRRLAELERIAKEKEAKEKAYKQTLQSAEKHFRQKNWQEAQNQIQKAANYKNATQIQESFTAITLQ